MINYQLITHLHWTLGQTEELWEVRLRVTRDQTGFDGPEQVSLLGDLEPWDSARESETQQAASSKLK